MHGNMLFFGYPLYRLEILFHRLPLELGVAPLRTQPGIGSFGPAGALVGEIKRVVVVDGEDQLRIVGDLQCSQTSYTAPLRRADQHATFWVGLTYRLQRIGQVVVPQNGRELVVRLVQDLEQEAVGVRTEVTGNLLPLREKTCLAGCGTG